MLLARRVAWCCSIIAALAVSAVVNADSAWTAYSGQITWHLNGRQVESSGLHIAAGTEAITGADDQHLEFEIADSSSLTVISNELGLDHVSNGTLDAAGTLTISTDKATFEISKLQLQIEYKDGKEPLLVISGIINGKMQVDLFVNPAFKPGFTQEPPVFYAETSDSIITPQFAHAIDRADLAGKSLGMFVFYSNVEWSGGVDPSTQAPAGGAPRGGNGGTTCDKPVGQDVIVGELYSPSSSSSAQIGGVWYDSFSVGTTSCNIGDAVLTWEGSGGTVHPAIGQNMFRLMNGRFEQLGQSWLKHGFTVAAGNACGCGCTGPGGPTLFPGCSDPYGPSLNNNQSAIKPKFRVNPTTGVHFHGSNPGFTTNVDRRLEVRHSDLDSALNPGARYFVEGQYIHEEDAGLGNDDNNASYLELSITSAGTHEYSCSAVGTTQREQCGIRAWQDVDPTVTETDTDVPNDGLYIVSAKATDLGGGVWHYEYAVQNLNANRGVSSFSVPISPAANVTNIGFHDVDYHDGDGENSVNRDGTDWPGVFANGAVSWNMVDVGNNSNALLWGTLYNFRFDADVEPSPDLGDVTMTHFRALAGNPDSFTATTVVPEPSAVAMAVEGNAPVLLPTCQSTDVTLRIENGAEIFDPATPKMYHRYDGGAFVETALTPIGGDLYGATLPTPSCGDTVEFYFTAASTTGTLVSLPGEAAATNTYFVANVGFEEINTYLEANFESGLPADWVQNGLWNVSSSCSSIPTSSCGDSDGSSVAYFGQTSTCTFETGTHVNDSMFTPAIALPAGAEQVWLTYCSAFERDTTPLGDWPEVRITPDGEATDVIDQPAIGAFVGGAATWKERTIDLTAYAGQTVTIAFNFDNVFPSNDAFLGWMVDNVKVQALEIDCIPGCASPDGDMNIDGSANGADIQGFASALINGSTNTQDLAHGDFSGNGVIDMADMNDMVTALLSN